MASGTIMIVDGSAVARELCARILSNILDDNITVVTYGSGSDALVHLDQFEVDLITTTQVLPDMEGLTLCSRIRGKPDRRHIPVVVLAGEINSQLMIEGYKHGVSEYFDKSHGYQAFAEFIKCYLDQTRGHVGRILYVEDSRTAATLTRRTLERQGMDITHVLSVEEALKLLEEVKEGDTTPFDLLVTDYYLQDQMTGADLLTAVRTHMHLSARQLPILVITSKDDAETQIELLTSGANDLIQKPLLEEALVARVKILLALHQQNDALRMQADDIERVINSDSLTRTYNRRYLADRGPLMLADPEIQPIWVLIIDIDHLRQINSEHGHLKGDSVLAALGNLLRRHFRSGMVVRFGGEEFAVLLPQKTRNQALTLGEKLRQSMADEDIDGVRTTVSIGLACSADHPGADLNQLIALADQSLSAAKEHGRNRIYLTDSNKKVLPVKLMKKAD